MSKIAEFFKNGRIQVALATGICIVALAYFSKRVLPEPIHKLYLAIPPFIMTLYEGFAAKKEHTNYSKTLFWIAAIFVATALIIVVNAR
jgi:hypothetical protein